MHTLHKCVCERESVHVRIGTHGGQYSKFNTLSLELQGVLSLLTWVLGPELWFYGRIGQTLTRSVSLSSALNLLPFLFTSL